MTDSMITPEILDSAYAAYESAKRESAHEDAWVEAALTAALALHKPTMPGEIEGLIERAEKYELACESYDAPRDPLIHSMAVALRSAALEFAKIADFIEPHWRGAGVKLEAAWIIDIIGKLSSDHDALALEVERLHERLEDNHEYQLIDGKTVRVDVPPGSVPDGIECRDETIKLKRERIRELEADLAAAKDERDKFMEQAAARDERDRDMQDLMRINNELVADLAAARNKTIEKCAQAAEQYMADSTPRARGAAIRALATGETAPSEDRI